MNRPRYGIRSSRGSWYVISALAATMVAIPQVASAQTLLESSRFAAGLIRPLDNRAETNRALGRAGRADPFVPLNITTPPDTSVAEGATVPPVVRPVTAGTSRRPVATSTTPVTPANGNSSSSDTSGQVAVEPEIFIDPAEFAKRVQVSGVVTIGNESYALLSAENTLRDVVQTGDFYETAEVASVSQFGRSVSLSEGGETVMTNLPQ
ncbi:MAG: hypothetical protein AAGB13_01895 [Cyanobacteria bacterium P01_F01_bin.33]